MLSLFFVSGFSIVFITLGASASAIGRLLLAYRYEANIVGGAVVIIFGLFMVGLFKAPWFYRDVRFHGPRRGGRPIAAFGMGLAFSFGWTPCIGPILGAILTVSAVSTDGFNGMLLLGIYSLGLGVPFLLAAAFTDTFLRRVKGIRLAGRTIQTVSGCILIVMGVAMITGYLSMFAFWLLKTFPVLSTIGELRRSIFSKSPGACAPYLAAHWYEDGSIDPIEHRPGLRESSPFSERTADHADPELRARGRGS